MSDQIMDELGQAVSQYNHYYDASQGIAEPSDEARRLSKRASFLLLQGKTEDGIEQLSTAKEKLETLAEAVGNSTMLLESEAYKVATEEYMEAQLLAAYVGEWELDIESVLTSPTRRLAAFCDFTGELVRFAVGEATDRRTEQVEQVKTIIETVLTELTDTKVVYNKYLRNKFDQVERNLRKIENILYEVRLKE